MQRRQDKRFWAIAVVTLLALGFAIRQWDAGDPAGAGEASSPPMGEEGVLLTSGPELHASGEPAGAPEPDEHTKSQQQRARIQFTVLDWAGDPVHGAAVSINANTYVTDPGTGRPAMGWAPRVTGLTDAKGIVEFDAKQVNPPGSTATLQWRAQPPADREDLLLAGRAGMLVIESTTVRLSRGHVIAGIVLDAKRNPLPGLVVHYSTGIAEHAAAMPITDEQGRFRFRPLPKAQRAPYRLWVSAPVPPPGKGKPYVLENSTEAWGGEEHLEIVVEPIPDNPGYFRPVRGR